MNQDETNRTARRTSSAAGQIYEEKEGMTEGIEFTADPPRTQLRLNTFFRSAEGNLTPAGTQHPKLVLVLGGEGLLSRPAVKEPLIAGDVLVIPVDCPYEFEQLCGFRFCEVLYDPKQLLEGRPALERMRGFRMLFRGGLKQDGLETSWKKLNLSSEQLVYTTSLLTTLKTESDGVVSGRELVIEGVFLLLVAYIARLCEQQSDNFVPPALRLANVVSHVQRHYHEALRVEDLARMAHLSPSQFQRTFKRTYGITPQKYVRQVRLYKACELLKDPNQDITNIAYETGFSSSSFFTTQFKQAFGETPTQYRRKLWELQPPADQDQPPPGLMNRLKNSLHQVAGFLPVLVQSEMTQCVPL